MGRLKTSFRGGDLTHFKEKIERLCELEQTFKVELGGLSRGIKYESGKVQKYFGIRGKKNKINGLEFIMQMRRSVDRYLENNVPPVCNGIPQSQTFNQDAIEKNLKKPVSAIDITKCYWVSAYKLGFISEHLYNKGMTSGKKEGLVVSIGSLNKMTLKQSYVKGELIEEGYDKESHDRYSPFYRAIIHHVRDLMMEIYEKVGDKHFYMWLTDCAFVDSSKVDDVLEIFEKWGYSGTHNLIEFVGISEEYVHWFDNSKVKDKVIGIGKRNIQEEYKKWKDEIEFQKAMK